MDTLGQSDYDNFAEVMEILNLADAPKDWHDSWRVSQSTYPSDGIWFVQDDYVLDLQSVLRLPEESLEALLCTAAMIRNNAPLSRLAWHYQSELFMNSVTVNPWTVYIPNPQAHMGKYAALFPLVVLFSNFRACENMYRTKGISHDIMADTLSDVVLSLNHYRTKFGHWGIENLWLYYHFSGRLFRLGRLQFALDTFDGDILVYRDKRANRTISLSEPGIKYRHDGQVDGTSHLYDSLAPWMSNLQMEEGFISGNPISPYGAAISTPIRLSREDWELSLTKGDQVLAIHIPEGSKLDHGECGKSIYDAEIFFGAFFHDVHVKAYTCNTWLFDSQFQSLLPETSNIVRFQREFYLYPTFNNEKSFIKEVFGGHLPDPARSPRDTSLRRAILDHIKSGGYLRSAAGFILRDDLNWGSQLYQRAFRNECKPK